MVHIYIDAEFDAVKINGKYCQMVVSLGAVLKKDAQEATFYSLVCPKNFRRLPSVVSILTHLHESAYRNAMRFSGGLMNVLYRCKRSTLV